MKVGLGTAQFGSVYGVTNAVGQVQPAAALAMMQFALENGIDLFDTAPAYGTAEELIGSALPVTAKIVTKTHIARRPSFSGDGIAAVRTSFLESLGALRRASVYGLLIHSPDDLLRPGGDLIVELLLELRDRGAVQKVGVSVLKQEHIEHCLRRYRLDLYQIPMNYVDQRIVRSGLLKDLQDSGAEIHARSIFLQGILLAQPDDLPAYFSPWRDKLAMIRSELTAAGVAPGAAGIAFVRSRTPASYAIVGATSIAELQQLLQQSHAAGAGLRFDDFAIDDEALIDPWRWPAFGIS
jgi:aryl-alcohol dehydrogenase-like predicted oxidoreductase